MVLKVLRLVVACLYGIVAILTVIFVILLVDRFPTLQRAILGGRSEKVLSDVSTRELGPASGSEEQAVNGASPAASADIIARGSKNLSSPSHSGGGVTDGLGVSIPPRQEGALVAGLPSPGSTSESPQLTSVPMPPGSAKLGAQQTVSAVIVPYLEKCVAALEQHDTQTARQLLGAALAEARNDVDKAKIGRWFALCDALDEFWRVMGQIVARLEPLTVISVAQTEIIVVEASPQTLTVRAAGQNRTYALREIPAVLVKELARRSFGQTPSSKVVFAIYLAVDPKGDRELSRRLLLEAMGGGADPGEVVLELSAFVDRGMLGVYVEGTNLREADPAETVGTLFGSVDQSSWPSPEPTAPSESPPLGENSEAGATSDKARLARQLLEELKDKQLAVNVRLAKIDQARQLAEQAGEVELVLSCIQLQAQYRQLDRFTEATAALKALAERFPSRDVQRDVARAALNLASQAFQARRLPEADALLDLALSSARKIGNRAFIQEALAAKKLVEAARKQ